MAQGNLYQIDSTGGLRRMTPSAPGSENEMQSLVARFPELISDGDGELLLIKREQSVPDAIDGAGRWSIDHLFVTKGAIPVLVELKRAVDTRLRREVVGQMLDYAANATVHWQPSMIAESFAGTVRASGLEPDKVLAEFTNGAEPDAFWEQVGSNLRAGRIKLVFVADVIPRELARIVEFMNDQMDADVRAVELRWFGGEGGHTTLSPRIIGETERSAVAKPVRRGAISKLDLGEWVNERLGPLGAGAVSAAERFIAIIEAQGGSTGIPATQGSIYSCFSDATGRTIYPFHVWPSKKPTVSLSLSYLKPYAQYAADSVRQALYDEAVNAFGPLTSRNLNGFPGFPLESLNDPQVADRFQAFVGKLLVTGTIE